MYPKLTNYCYNYLHNITQSSKDKSDITAKSSDNESNILTFKQLEKNVKSKLNGYKKYIDNYYKNRADTEKFNKLINLIDPFRTYKYNLECTNNIQLISSTWLSIWEILNEFCLIPDRYEDQTYILFCNDSFGSCISSVNHYIKTMTTIKSFVWYASGNDNNLQKNYSTRWITDSTMDVSNIQKITSYLTEKFNLYISDICANSTDYTQQESTHMKNNIGQILLGIKGLLNGGSMIIKMYTIFTDTTKSLLSLLHKCFESVSIYKPLCSKAINGDIFVVCKNYTYSSDIENTLYNYTESQKYTVPVISDILPIDLTSYYLIQEKIFRDLIVLTDIILLMYGEKSSEDFNFFFKILKNDYRTEHASITSQWIKKYPINSLKYKDKLQIK